MGIQTGILVILFLCVIGMAGILVVLVMLVREFKHLINIREGGSGQIRGLELFDQLPQDYRDAVNHIVEQVLGDESPDMNDAFRAYQAEIFLAGTLKEDEKPDLKLFEVEALAFRDGWQRREQRVGVVLSK